jgi:multicomponent Na+:H+ antiporter subunit D
MDLSTTGGENVLFAAVFALIFAWVAVYAVAIPQGDRRWWSLLGGLVPLALGSVLAPEGMARMVIVDLAAFLTVGLVWVRGSTGAVKAARTYLALLLVAMICLGAGLGLLRGTTPLPHPLDGIALALFVVGIGLKLALVPFYFWLPVVAEQAAPMTTAVIVAVVDLAALAELLQLRAGAPWLFDRYRGVWLAMALLSMFVGALLALAQNDLKRMLAFSTIDDMGYLVLGVAMGSPFGMTGATLGALSHGLLKVLLFGAVGVAEHRLGKPVTLDMRGLAALFPTAGAAFIIGALGMVGVPPLFGFVGRWRLYLAGAEYGGTVLLLAMILATGLSLLYYARAIHRVWLGASSEAPLTAESRLASGALVALSSIVLLLGLFPLILTQFLP